MARPERPVNPADGPVEALAAELRALRRRAGSPGYRELAQRAGLSAAALANAAAGRRLPTWVVMQGFVRACGEDPVMWETRWRQASAEVAAARPPGNGNGNGVGEGVGDGDGESRSEPTGPRDPFLGLASYGPADVDWFFGRDRAVAQLVEWLGRRRFVALFGPSGSGKSSLLRAGLIAAVAGAERPSEPGEPIAGSVTVLVTPGASPRKSLRDALPPVPGGVPSKPVLLVVDQFEELFTMCQDPAERTAFVAELAALAGHAQDAAGTPAAPDRDTGERPGSRVVIGVRSDFYGRCTQLPVLAELLAGATLPVPAMTPDELQAVVTEPVRRAGGSVERALVATILADVAGRPGALPLVSHALLQTWRHRRGDVVTLADYEAVGGIAGSVARTAEAVYQGLTEAQTACARQILTRLVALGEGMDDTRRRVERAELDLPEAAAVLEALAAARLVMVDDTTVQLTHEALIDAWPRLQDWLQADRETLRRHRRLTEAGHSWEAHGRDAGALYRGAILDAWDDDSLDGLNTLERDFLAASRRHRAQQHALGRRRWRAAFATVATAALISSGLAVVAVTESRQATRERDLAVALRLAAEARGEMPGDIRRALQTALDAVRTQPDPQAIAALRQATAVAAMYVPGEGADLQLLGVALSPDGRRLVTTAADGHVGLWAWSSGRPQGAGPLRMTGHQGPARCPAFTRSGLVVTAGDDGTVRVWDIGKGQGAAVLRGHRGPVRCVAVAADVPRAASAGDDGTVRVWDVARPGAPSTALRGHAGPVLGVALSPDGRLAASAGRDGTVRLWPLDGTGTSRVLQTGRDPVHALAFDPDGGLAAGGDDGVTRYWAAPVAGGPVVLVPPSPEERSSVRMLAFHDDGELMAAVHASGDVVRRFRSGGFRDALWSSSSAGGVASVVADGDHLVGLRNDGAIASWDAATDTGVTVHDTLRGAWVEAFDAGQRTWRSDTDLPLPWQSDDTPPAAPGYVGPVALDGTKGSVAGWDGDGQIRVRVGTGTSRDLTLPARSPIHLAFSPDGGYLLAADELARGGSTVTTYALPSLRRLATTDLLSAAWIVALSPGGRHVAGPGSGSSIEVVDRQSTARIVLPGHTAFVTALAFAGDGTLVTAAVDGVRSWDVTGRRGLDNWKIPPGVESGARAVGAAGARVAAASSDGVIRVWRRGEQTAPVTLGGHRGRVVGMAFAASSRQLVSAGSDGTVRVWPDEDTDPLVFTGFEDIAAVAISPDGQRLSVAHSVAGDRVVTTWRCPECRTSTADLVELAETRLAAMRD
jgi:WD40 repeat protein